MQLKWRIAGGIATAAAAGMAWHGARSGFMTHSLPVFAAYWGTFLLLMAAALYVAVLDMRYIRLRYELEKRELYRQTIGGEAFRQAIVSAQKENAGRQRSPGGNGQHGEPT